MNKLQLLLIDLIVVYLMLCTLVKSDDDLAGPLGLVLVIVAIIYNVKVIRSWRKAVS